MITGKVPPESQRRLARVAEGVTDPYEPLAGRFPGYPPGFLEAIDLSMRVMPRQRLQSAGEWIDMIQRGEEEERLASDAAPASIATPVAPPTTAEGARKLDSFIENNSGYFFGLFLAAGGAVVVGLGALVWWLVR